MDLKRDVPAFAYADLRSIAEGDVCPRCGKPVAFAKGIEVGHVFKLGTKYSTALNAIYLDENGKEQTIIMGCYGIGVSRVVAACIEQNNDGDGIAFPRRSHRSTSNSSTSIPRTPTPPPRPTSCMIC